MLLSKAWEKYESDKKIEGFSPHTLKAYRLQATLLIRYFNDIEIGTFKIEQLKCFLSESSEQLKPSSLTYRIHFMKSLFRWSHEEGHIPKNPVAKIREPKVRKRIPKFLTEREINTYVKVVGPLWKEALSEFMFSTGCRIGEIVSLEKIVLIGLIGQRMLEAKEIGKTGSFPHRFYILPMGGTDPFFIE